MKIYSFLAVILVTACPLQLNAQDDAVQQGVRAGEQIILSRIMADKRAIYAQAMQMTDGESRAFWSVYDEYEAKVKKIDDRFIKLINDYATTEHAR